MSRTWSFLSTHGDVLLALAGRPDLRLREIANGVGLTPRAVQSIVTDLVDAGYLERRREGRRNFYRVRGDRPIGDSATADHVVADLIRALVTGPGTGPPRPGQRNALVLGCSDHRFQEPLRTLLASLGLLLEAEIVLWPGGGASLTGPEGGLILEIMSLAVGAEPPTRVVLVAHEGCHVRGAFRSTGDSLADAREVNRRRHRTIELVRTAFGVRAELWYLSARGASLVGAPARAGAELESHARIPPGVRA
ncbi:MAG TPA: helix-turn-helix domain-containing protein [Actinomycetota bacterium]|jgi:DNA-binding transcriptional ArsR family regulator|nr:helix-turn-helix domain-containing protein [Actinomycetota bacterium]